MIPRRLTLYGALGLLGLWTLGTYYLAFFRATLPAQRSPSREELENRFVPLNMVLCRLSKGHSLSRAGASERGSKSWVEHAYLWVEPGGEIEAQKGRFGTLASFIMCALFIFLYSLHPPLPHLQQ